MEMLAVFMIILILMALVGVLAYLLYDYFNFKDIVNADVKKVNVVATQEKEERLSNLKYIVEQVNTVNTDIYNTFSCNINGYELRMDQIENNNGLLLNGLSNVMRFNVDGRTTPLINLPGGVTPNLELIRNVTAISGMNITQLTSNVPTKFCSAANPSRCIEFPNSTGDTYITTMYPGKSIVMANDTMFYDDVMFMNTTGSYGSISGVGTGNNDVLLKGKNNIHLQPETGAVSIGRSITNPLEGMLNINAPSSTTNLFHAKGSGNSVKILNDGTLVVNKIQFGDTPGTDIQRNGATNKLVITAPSGVNLVTPSGTTPLAA